MASGDKTDNTTVQVDMEQEVGMAGKEVQMELECIVDGETEETVVSGRTHHLEHSIKNTAFSNEPVSLCLCSPIVDTPFSTWH